MPSIVDQCNCEMCRAAYLEAHPEEAQQIVTEDARASPVSFRTILEHAQDRCGPRRNNGNSIHRYARMRLGRRRNHDQRYSYQAVYRWLEQRLDRHLCINCEEEGSCTCVECDCGHTVASGGQCEHCERCTSCCECHHCSSCDSTFSDPSEWCCDCDHCTECCTCADSRMPKRDLSKKLHGTPSARYPRHVGVEIECGTKGDGYSDLRDALETWGAGAHDDGSINLDGSLEIATAPAQGEAFEKQIDDMTRALRACKGKVDSSCGLHVHISAKDLVPSQVLGAVRLYAKVEPALYSIVAPSRKDGSYSRMWGTTFEVGEVFEKGTIGERFDRLEATVYGSKQEAESVKQRPHKHQSRYHGLNLNALLLYGTLEFRLHHGTVNATKIKMWAAVCSKIVQYAKEHSEKEIAKLSGSAWEVLLKILKGDPEVVAWAKARREHFQAVARYEKGLIENAPARLADHEASEA